MIQEQDAFPHELAFLSTESYPTSQMLHRETVAMHLKVQTGKTKKRV
jgi:hypothetical protein